MNAKSRYIPLDATEKAALEDINTFLPIEVYEKLATLIRQALKKLPTGDAALNDTRSHNAISIDGDRGTGKTAVLVNLKRYLSRADGLGGTTDAAPDRELLSSVHVLDPIDPTLLEDGESLFLHVVVAAVLHDKELKERQRCHPERQRELNIALERLAHGLESVESQKTSRGMDTIRALHSNQHLGECVQNFFKAALHLLEKKLLVLLIDDVDTALNRAFENLDIIRRYLTTPYVLPILTGDRGLYDEVVWRDFHGRLTKDSNYLKNQAYGVARDLATEYQRKILPVQRRLTMPQVADYWKDDGVKLRGGGKNILPLQNFYAWLQIFIGGPVNGREGSEMDIPIPSVRALIQLVNHCGDLIPGLPEEVCNATSAINAKRAWQMPEVPPDAVEQFGVDFQRDAFDTVTMKKAYNNINNRISIKDTAKEAIDVGSWVDRLKQYFIHEPEAGKAYLSLQAMEYWQKWRQLDSGDRQGSVFDTPLFQPLEHEEEGISRFNRPYDLGEWSDSLEGRLPDVWLGRAKKCKTILPYPIPEIGAILTDGWDYRAELGVNEEALRNFIDGKGVDVGVGVASFFVSLCVQRNFYANDKVVMGLNVGRLFELIIASLVGDVTPSDMRRIISSAPFYSANALAPTKTVYGKEEGDISVRKNSVIDVDVGNYIDNQLMWSVEGGAQAICDSITGWRKRHHLDGLIFSPWLVYKVFNKVFSQVGSGLLDVKAAGLVDVPLVVKLLGKVFYATWSAFGSFEKGRLFGFDDMVATSNVVALKNFVSGSHYRQNIEPFFSYGPGDAYGKKTGTVSYFLEDHPVKGLMDSLILNIDKADWKYPVGVTQGVGQNGSAT